MKHCAPSDLDATVEEYAGFSMALLSMIVRLMRVNF